MSKLRPHLEGEKHPLAKLTSADVHAIRKSRGTHRDIARRYGVSESTIYRLKARLSWAWLGPERVRLKPLDRVRLRPERLRL